MFAYGGDGLRFQSDDLITLITVLVGGGFALLGGWLGARWAAKYQDQQAATIAQRIRQEERDESTRERLGAMRGELKSAHWDVQQSKWGTLGGTRSQIFRRHLQELLAPNDQLHNVRLFSDLNHDTGAENIEDAITDVEAALARLPKRLGPAE